LPCKIKGESDFYAAVFASPIFLAAVAARYRATICRGARGLGDRKYRAMNGAALDGGDGLGWMGRGFGWRVVELWIASNIVGRGAT